MNPNIKCTCPFGKPEVAIAEDCPIHGSAAIIKKRFEDLNHKIDYSNYEQLAKDVWLFLTDDSMPDKAKIKKAAAIHEIKVMIESAVLFQQGAADIEIKRLTGLLRKVVTREQSEVHPRYQTEAWEKFKKEYNIHEYT